MFRKEKILIVEDETIIALGLKSFLESKKLDVIAFVQCHEEAEGILKKEKEIDLIIMDINLKGNIDGIQSCNMLFPKYQIPIIFFSAYEDSQTLHLIQESYALGYIAKPYKEAELLMLIFFILKNNFVPPLQPKKQLDNKIKLDNEFTFCTQKQLLFHYNKEINLSIKEKNILNTLCNHKNSYVSYEQLFANVWSNNNFCINKIRGSIFRLKKKLPLLNLKNSHLHGYKID